MHLSSQEDPTNTKILWAGHSGPDGTKTLNAPCNSTLTAKDEPMQVWDQRHNAYARVGLHLGDTVLCTGNLWNSDLQNGSTGAVAKMADSPQTPPNCDKGQSDLELAAD